MDIQLKPLPEERRSGHNTQYVPPPPPPPRYGRTFMQSCLVAGCATVMAPVILAFSLFALIIFLIPDDAGDASGTLSSFYQGPLGSNVREKVLRRGAAGAGTIAVVNLQGVIDGDGSPMDGTGKLAFVAEQLKAAAGNDAVKAVVLQIDSPGGGLSASDLLYNEVRNLRGKGKKVVAWGGGLMASGGYYVALAAEGIVASPTCTVGSIGVIMSHFQVSGLMDTLGIKADPIAAGERKDIGSPYREMTPEERQYLQAYVDASHRRFVDLVAQNRNIPPEEARKLSDGNILTADTALENGLVDRIGYIEDALAWAEDLAGEEDMRVVAYRRLFSFSDMFMEASRAAATAAVETATPAPSTRAMALWNGE